MFICLCRIPRDTTGVSKPTWEASPACVQRCKKHEIGQFLHLHPRCPHLAWCWLSPSPLGPGAKAG